MSEKVDGSAFLKAFDGPVVRLVEPEALVAEAVAREDEARFIATLAAQILAGRLTSLCAGNKSLVDSIAEARALLAEARKG